MKATPQIMVGVSGGVDSSVSALLLKHEGLSLAGMFMKNWEEDDRFGSCPAEQDAQDAEKICNQIGIQYYARNFAAEYWDEVFEHFLAEYRSGRTPNPDILCNREIKFKTFLQHAHDLGAEKIATGHYAQVDCLDGRWRLLRGADQNKDQSYFLYTLGQQQLSRTIFPIGHLSKPEVRKIALNAKLATHAKKDSTGICFIGERNFREFLSQYIPNQIGPLETPEGKLIGEHSGSMYFTLGQRHGLGIGGVKGYPEAPWFVVGKDVQRNAVIVSQGNEHGFLYATRLHASQLSLTHELLQDGEFICTAKTRYRQADQACSVKVRGDLVMVEFEQAQRAVTPGQSIVFYQGKECIGGAVIDASNAPYGGLAS